MTLPIEVNLDRLWNRLMELGRIGETRSGGVTRTSLTKEDLQARELLLFWMKDAGLQTETDPAGNIIGKWIGEDTTAPSVLTGSHIDSVFEGGRFDGPLGVLGALEAIQTLMEKGWRPKRTIEVISFTDEEGARFSGGFTGSKGLTGDFTREDLEGMVDADGITYSQAFLQAGLNPDDYEKAKRDRSTVHAFVELHIEQGRVLEHEGLPVGIVTGIAGPSWLEVAIYGEAGHAGTTPMHLRRDPGLGAAELALQVEHIAREHGGVGTMGRIELKPGGVNIIPASAHFFIDLRHIDKAQREAMKQKIEAELERISQRRQLTFDIKINMEIDPVPCSPRIQSTMKEAAQQLGQVPFALISGAGHDAMVLSSITEVGMIFVRSKDGISHNPKEWSSPEDIKEGVQLLMQTIWSLANE